MYGPAGDVDGRTSSLSLSSQWGSLRVMAATIRYRYCPECAVGVPGRVSECPDCGHTLEKSIAGLAIVIVAGVLAALLVVALVTVALGGAGSVDPGV
jgi:hypothetical protein